MRADDDPRQFLSRVRPMYPKLYNLAYAICGDPDRAGQALQAALLRAWWEGGSAEGLRAMLIHCAVRMAKGGDGSAWDGLFGRAGGPLSERIAAESGDARRVLALRYGCGLSCARIAHLTHGDVTRVRRTLSRLESRLRGSKGASRNGIERAIARCVRAELAVPDARMPDIDATFRAFEAEAHDTPPHTFRGARILRWILTGVFAIVCVALFWLIAVLIQS